MNRPGPPAALACLVLHAATLIWVCPTHVITARVDHPNAVEWTLGSQVRGCRHVVSAGWLQ